MPIKLESRARSSKSFKDGFGNWTNKSETDHIKFVRTLEKLSSEFREESVFNLTNLDFISPYPAERRVKLWYYIYGIKGIIIFFLDGADSRTKKIHNG